MYIEPNTNIFILKEVPIDNTYNHTIYFDDKTTQYNYFVSKRKHSLLNQSYQRVNKGVCRVNLRAELLYDCNYMMFQNESFGSKWFYAFITKVEYVNNVVSEIYYQIDVIQSWFLDDIIWKDCFIEREHTESDFIGEHIVPEPVSIGEYVVDDYGSLVPIGDKKIVLIGVSDFDADDEGSSVQCHLINGVISGVKLYAYDSEDIESINTLLDSHKHDPNAIVCMYMAPMLCLGETDLKSGGLLTDEYLDGHTFNVFCDTLDGTEKFGNYEPKNMKMLTYPYNYFGVCNGSGDSIKLRYEFFEECQPIIRVACTLNQPVELIARPLRYKGVEETTVNPNESVMLNNFPMCSWSTDTYKTWVSQSVIPTITGLGNGAISLVTSLGLTSMMSVPKSNTARQVDIAQAKAQNSMRADVVGSGASFGSGLLDFVGNMVTAQLASDSLRGNNSSSNVDWATNTQQFYKGRYHVNESNARIIDSFFNMYGYQVNRIGKPTFTNRKYWNYVKTNGCNILAKMPSDDRELFCAIFDKGITFWKNGDYVGNYSLDNREGLANGTFDADA